MFPILTRAPAPLNFGKFWFFEIALKILNLISFRFYFYGQISLIIMTNLEIYSETNNFWCHRYNFT